MKDYLSSKSAVEIYNSTRRPDDPKDIEYAARKISAIEDVKKCAPLFSFLLNKEDYQWVTTQRTKP